MKGKLNYNKKKVYANRNKSVIPPLIFSLKNDNIRRNPLSTNYSVNRIRQMDWKQLKRRFPQMNPTADADFDGLVNSRDCKPLDPSKDGAFSRFIGIVTGGKKGQSAEEYKAEKASKSSIKFSKKLEKDVAKGKAEEKRIIVEKWKKIREQELAVKEAGKVSIREKIRAGVRAVESTTRPRGIVGEISTAVGKTAQGFFEGTTRQVVTGVGPNKIVRYVKVRSPSAQAIEKTAKVIAKVAKRAVGVGEPLTVNKKTAKGVKGAGAGRPKQSYKYKDPRTGQPISAVEYHALRKQLKRQAQTLETKAEIQQRFTLAKRGLSPEEVAAAQEEMNARMARLRAIQETSQQNIQPAIEIVKDTQDIQIPEQQVQQMQQIRPQGIIKYRRISPQQQQQNQSGIPPGYRLQEDLMTGRKRLVPLPQPEAWTR